jgi:hypothetical protein
MRSRGVVGLCGLGLYVVTRPAPADPVSNTTTALPPPVKTVPHLALEPPGVRPLRFSFSAVSVPGYELLGLPTFSFDATWVEKGRFGVHTFASVTPALELDCSALCQAMLERVSGVESRFALGSVGPSVPDTWLYLGGGFKQLTGVAPGSAARLGSGGFVRAGLAGRLAF